MTELRYQLGAVRGCLSVWRVKTNARMWCRRRPGDWRLRSGWPVLAAVLALALAGCTSSGGNSDGIRPPTAPSTAAPSAVPTTSASSTSTTPASTPTPTVPTAPVAGVIRFDGFEAVKLGGHAADLAALGYGAGRPLTFGCVEFSRTATLPQVLLDPLRDAVVAIAAPASAATEAGIGVGATAETVLAVYAGYQVRDLRDRMFGQGGDGILVTSDAGSIGFATDNNVVVHIEIGEGEHATGMEIGCAPSYGSSSR